MAPLTFFIALPFAQIIVRLLKDLARGLENVPCAEAIGKRNPKSIIAMIANLEGFTLVTLIEKVRITRCPGIGQNGRWHITSACNDEQERVSQVQLLVPQRVGLLHEIVLRPSDI